MKLNIKIDNPKKINYVLDCNKLDYDQLVRKCNASRLETDYIKVLNLF